MTTGVVNTASPPGPAVPPTMAMHLRIRHCRVSLETGAIGIACGLRIEPGRRRRTDASTAARIIFDQVVIDGLPSPGAAGRS